VTAGIGAGLLRLAEGALRGAAGGTAGGRAGRRAGGARGPSGAVPGHGPVPAAVGALGGRVAAAGANTSANRAAFGSVGTAGDSAAWPAVRLFPLNNVPTRSLLAVPCAAAGTDKAAAGQALPDQVLAKHPHVLSHGQVWLPGRLWHGVRQIAALAERTHVLIRVKSDITLKRISEILPDGSYRAQLSGDGLSITVGVIEYFVDVEGHKVPEIFCLVTDLLDWEEYLPCPGTSGHAPSPTGKPSIKA
jgi:hypothetical protein